MMFTPPFFGFPNRMNYYRYQYGYPHFSSYSSYKKNYYDSNVHNYNTATSVPSNCTQKNYKTSSNTNKTETTSTVSEDRSCFEIMGIKLYFDDLLLIGLIFFLYSEGVQDEMLFMALILLLLS